MNKEFLFSTLPLVFALAAAFTAITKIRPSRETENSDYGLGATAIFTVATLVTALISAYNL